MSELIGVVREEEQLRLTVDARQCRRLPRTPAAGVSPPHMHPSVIVLPMRAEVAAALSEARRLGKRFYLVTRD